MSAPRVLATPWRQPTLRYGLPLRSRSVPRRFLGSGPFNHPHAASDVDLSIDAVFRARPTTLHTPDTLSEWTRLSIPPGLAKVMLDINHTAPLTTQKTLVPAILTGRHIALQAETGSGKTLAYLLPLLTRILAWSAPNQPPGFQFTGPQALIVTQDRVHARQLFRMLRELVRRANLDIALINCVTSHILAPDGSKSGLPSYGPGRINRPSILVATAASLLPRNPYLMSRLEAQLKAARLVVVDELQPCLDTVDQAQFYRLMALLIRGRDPLAVPTAQALPGRPLPIVGNLDQAHYSNRPFTSYRHELNSKTATPAPYTPPQFIFCDSKPFSDPALRPRILEKELGLSNIQYLDMPIRNFYQPVVDEILLPVPSALTVGAKQALFMRLLRTVILRVRQLPSPSTHRLILVVSDDFPEAERNYKHLQTLVHDYQRRFEQNRLRVGRSPPSVVPNDHSPTAAAPDDSYLFQIQPQYFPPVWTRKQRLAMKAALHAATQGAQPVVDWYPPGMPPFAGPISVVFIGGPLNQTFVFPQVASVLLLRFGQDIYDYLFWAGRAGRDRQGSEIISLVPPEDRAVAGIVERLNRPLVINEPKQLLKIPMRTLPKRDQILKPFDGTNLTGVRKAGEVETPEEFPFADLFRDEAH
ncbi:P-loop containing nucleoside triphosphate hydrolase protein [Dimargaris cristalligena]|uniref:ATP-dependent RNA helicase n=1 Tax=Dimargaris cristalligena TaxID=215637 RepID=A0A4P9ZSI9_9FUNG|nr:P-loop containing nucleoside triphosphate hydrolase protein [Dimargaris cristalligena]|eukprot:RKP36524.1 P-loop containing nucleoside triphosphate hydrolase protein [Dimargaris cristalligena]